MPSHSVVRGANLASVPGYRPTALFLGGTSGVGQAIAGPLARVTKSNSMRPQQGCCKQDYGRVSPHSK
ncbi:oxidoreductase, putative [Rhizoctonia solani AG-3 Rhs1AP]|uniref:Oxidoreductase, putative n=1 Tax=Rhizoctonia solani AG-3 Rhs1AP TaxID=1086054 RepID=X8IVH2_9AGAM|nr:oxidoreductase, putative [Rhizoctonia solani AG-3 Rhs1AP]